MYPLGYNSSVNVEKAIKKTKIAQLMGLRKKENFDYVL